MRYECECGDKHHTTKITIKIHDRRPVVRLPRRGVNNEFRHRCTVQLLAQRVRVQGPVTYCLVRQPNWPINFSFLLFPLSCKCRDGSQHVTDAEMHLSVLARACSKLLLAIACSALLPVAILAQACLGRALGGIYFACNNCRSGYVTSADLDSPSRQNVSDHSAEHLVFVTENILCS